jgi:hypothetical protein
MEALIIKYKCNLSERKTIQQIQENMYMQYFIGYSSYCEEEPFDSSLFVDIRKRLGVDRVNKINEQILVLSHNDDDTPLSDNITKIEDEPSSDEEYKKGKLLMDVIACP